MMRMGTISVTKRSGETERRKCTGLGRPFDVAGEPHCYGYLTERAGGRVAVVAAPRRDSHPRTGCSCGSRDDLPRDSDCWNCQHDY